MVDTNTNNYSLNNNESQIKTIFGGASYNNAKQNESKGSNILMSVKENEEKKVKNDKLCEQLKNSIIVLAHKQFLISC